MERAETYRMRPRFAVKEGGDGTAYVAAEPLSSDAGWPKAAEHLAFELPPGTTYEKAEEATRWLNENVKAISTLVFR